MNWWQKLTGEVVTGRRATPADRPELAALLARAWHHHGTLAVEEQAAALNSGFSAFAVTRSNGPVGFVGSHLRDPVPDSHERWADLLLVAVARGWGADDVLTAAMATLVVPLRQANATALVCLASEHWLSDGLLAADFVVTDQVITYARSSRQPLTPSAPVAHIRPANPNDADVILALNAAAFAPVWRYDTHTILSWLLTADHAVLAFLDNRAVGFALTARPLSGEYAQLIRLAVHPDVQGRGIGRQLTWDAATYAQRSGAPGLALNTQASNVVSRHLYEALGFQLYGEAVSMLVHALA